MTSMTQHGPTETPDLWHVRFVRIPDHTQGFVIHGTGSSMIS
jgi:hypothetical protein